MKPSLGKVISTVGTTVVAVSIIAGVILVGSPAEGRRDQLDSTRVEDLKGIMSATDSFWERNERLPESLEELTEEERKKIEAVFNISPQVFRQAARRKNFLELPARLVQLELF